MSRWSVFLLRMLAAAIVGYLVGTFLANVTDERIKRKVDERCLRAP